VTGLVCLYPDPVTGAGYTHGGRHYTAAQAADLIRNIPFAAISKQHSGMIVASADQDEVAPYSASVFTGAGLAARLESQPPGTRSRLT
jgi:hypothetical protein